MNKIKKLIIITVASLCVVGAMVMVFINSNNRNEANVSTQDEVAVSTMDEISTVDEVATAEVTTEPTVETTVEVTEAEVQEYTPESDIEYDYNDDSYDNNNTDSNNSNVVSGTYLGSFRLTAYCHCYSCNGEWAYAPTATGTMPQAGRTIAVDPNVIPYGSRVIINGHTYVAEDCGGAIVGNRIDIFFGSHSETMNFGVQYADVYLG